MLYFGKFLDDLKKYNHEQGIALDEFEISDRVGHKIGDDRADAVRKVLNRLK